MNLNFIFFQFDLTKRINPPVKSIAKAVEYDDDTTESSINSKLIRSVTFIFLLVNLCSIPIPKKNIPMREVYKTVLPTPFFNACSSAGPSSSLDVYILEIISSELKI